MCTQPESMRRIEMRWGTIHSDNVTLPATSERKKSMVGHFMTYTVDLSEDTDDGYIHKPI